MSDSELWELVYHGREERNLEYKRSMSWHEPETKAKITKSVMAMANIPDGGTIIIGMEKEGELYFVRGMEVEDARSFQQDDVMEHVNEWADPYTELTVTLLHKDAKELACIQVREFEQLPVVCKKEGMEGLKRGAFYTRSRRKYETAQVGSQSEMREILDLAVDKEIRRLRARGLIHEVQLMAPSEADRKAFDEQSRGL
jgi:predicted HTH transcriptional regulator